MNKNDYQKLVQKISPQENKLKNCLIAFFIGGTLGSISEGIVYCLKNCFYLSGTEAYTFLAIIIVFLGTLFTAFGFFDDWVSYAKAGLFLPTTGFAHSIASAALDYKKDGLITGLGSNFFKLAGSVILYGILSAVTLLIVRMMIGV